MEMISRTASVTNASHEKVGVTPDRLMKIKGLRLRLVLLLATCLSCRIVSHHERDSDPYWLELPGYVDTTPEGAVNGYLRSLREELYNYTYRYEPKSVRDRQSLESYVRGYEEQMEWLPLVWEIRQVQLFDDPRQSEIAVSAVMSGEGYLTLNRIDFRLIREGVHWKIREKKWGPSIEYEYPQDAEKVLGFEK